MWYALFDRGSLYHVPCSDHVSFALVLAPEGPGEFVQQRLLGHGTQGTPMLPHRCGGAVLIRVVWSEEERDTCYVGHSIYKLRQHIYKEMITWGKVAEVLSLVMLDASVV